MKTNYLPLVVLSILWSNLIFCQDPISDIISTPIDQFTSKLCDGTTWEVVNSSSIIEGCTQTVGIVTNASFPPFDPLYFYTVTGPGIVTSQAQPIPPPAFGSNKVYISFIAPTPGVNEYTISIFRKFGDEILLCGRLRFRERIVPRFMLLDTPQVTTQLATEIIEVCCEATENYTFNESVCVGQSISSELQLTIVPEVLSLTLGASVSNDYCISFGVEQSCTAPSNACKNLTIQKTYKDVLFTYKELDCDGNNIGVQTLALDNILTDIQVSCSPIPHAPPCNDFEVTTEVKHASQNFNDGSITLNPTGGSGVYEYFWSHNPSLPTSTNEVSNLFAGIYSFTVTDNVNCCIETGSVTVEECNLSVNIAPFANDEWTGLGLDAEVFGINGPFTYQWSTFETAPVINVFSPGNYCVTVTDTEGCTTENCYWATCGFNFVNYYIEDNFDGSSNIIVTNIEFGNTSYPICTWFDDFGQILSGDCSGLYGLQAGTYTLFLTDGLCTYSEYITIQPKCPLDVSLYEQGWQVCAEVSGSTGNYRYDWEFFDCETGVKLGDYFDGPSCVNSQVGYQFCVLVTDLDFYCVPESRCIEVGCFGPRTLDRLSNAGTDPAYEDQIDNSSLKVYPNPFKDHVYVTFHSEKVEEMEFYLMNALGKRIQSQSYSAIIGTNSFYFPIEEGVGAGVYFLATNNQSGDTKLIQKIIRE